MVSGFLFGTFVLLAVVFSGVAGAWRLGLPGAVRQAQARIEQTPLRSFLLGLLVILLVFPLILTLLMLPIALTRILGSLLLLCLLGYAGLGAAGLAARIGSGTERSYAGSLLERPPVWVELAAGLGLGGLAMVIVLPLISDLLDLELNTARALGFSLAFGVVAAGLLTGTVRRSLRGPGSDIRPFGRGLLLMGVAFIVPVVGWFLVLPLTVVLSLGAATFSLLRWMPARPDAGRKKSRTGLTLIISTLCLLPLATVSISAIAFFVSGAVAVEIASRLPAVFWLACAPAYTVLTVGVSIYALSTRRAAPARLRTTRAAAAVPGLLFVLPLLAIIMPLTALQAPAPTSSILEGLLPSGATRPDAVVWYDTSWAPDAIAHVPVPQHPYMAANPGSNMHSDAYMSDTYEASGPIGRGTQVSSRSQGFGGYGTVTFDSRGRLVAVYGNGREFKLELMDPYTLEELTSYSLPPRPLDFFFQGILPWKYIGAGIYFYLDGQDRAIVPTTKNTVQVVSLEERASGPEFRFEREYDLKGVVVSDQDSVAFVLPEWSGEYYWFATCEGVVGTIDVHTGKVLTLRLDDELIENSFAVGEDGVFIISDRAMYRFSSDGTGKPLIDWRTEYDRGPGMKPGHITRGSGTSVTLMGTPGEGLVAVTDNAEPRISLLLIGRSDGAVVCKQPLFEEGKSGTDLTTIGFEHADASGQGTGVYSIIVENNWGHHTFPVAHPEPGLTRVDVTRNSDGDYECSEVWQSTEKSIGGFRLSFGNGLVYMYTGGGSPLNSRWYFTALDFNSGHTVYNKLTGTGIGYNNWAGSLFLHPDGMAYSTTIFGLVMMRDSASD